MQLCPAQHHLEHFESSLKELWLHQTFRHQQPAALRLLSDSPNHPPYISNPDSATDLLRVVAPSSGHVKAWPGLSVAIWRGARWWQSFDKQSTHPLPTFRPSEALPSLQINHGFARSI